VETVSGGLRNSELKRQKVFYGSVRELVEAGGAVFVRLEGNVVYFRDPRDGKIISLYSSALQSTADVEAALKSHRERVHDFPPLELTDRILALKKQSKPRRSSRPTKTPDPFRRSCV
jgi:hypothetical protein